MVRKCIVCKKLWNKSENRSFHRFPRDIFQKNMWLERLSLVETDILGIKDALVCSDHFAPDDLVENISGKHVLKFKAVPKGYISVLTILNGIGEQNSDVDDSTVTTSKVSLTSKKRMFRQMSNSSTHSSNSPELETQLPSVTRVLESSDVILDKSLVTPLREKNSTADYSTDKTSTVSLSNKKRMCRRMSNSSTNSSTHSSSSPELETQLPSVTRRKFRMPRYMGDIHISDLSNPLIAKAAWKIAKEVVRKQRQKLILLQRRNRRLREKLFSLSSLLTHLSNNHYISSSAESVV